MSQFNQSFSRNSLEDEKTSLEVSSNYDLDTNHLILADTPLETMTSNHKIYNELEAEKRLEDMNSTPNSNSASSSSESFVDETGAGSNSQATATSSNGETEATVKLKGV